MAEIVPQFGSMLGICSGFRHGLVSAMQGVP